MRMGLLAWALTGMAAAAVGIGVGEFVGALIGGSSIIAAVGALVIGLQPPGGKDLMVALFGENDKLALEVMTAVGGILIGGIFGLLAKRDVRMATAGFLAFGVVAFLLVQRDPLGGPVAAMLAVLPAVVAGIVTLRWLAALIGRLDGTTPADAGLADAGLADAGLAEESASTGSPVARRSFLALTATLVAIGGVLALVGRYLGSQVPSSSPPIAIPPPGQSLPPAVAGADFGIDGLTPIVVPIDYPFYRIDTNLSVPRLDASTWSLRIHGMVDQEVVLTYAALTAMPLVERYVTIACVSNEVGGRLVGNAKWTGVPLVPILESAGVKAGATQLVGRSYDGWTSGFPTAHLSGAGSEAMIAVQMNGETLPPQHGFPARLIIPGLYGYVSATKWLTEIELTTLEAFDAYWVPLGWAKEAPILTQSRIDTPRSGGRVTPGSVVVAGVAWAPTRGITRVEVQLDDQPWLDAELSVPLSTASWIQWRAAVDVPAGTHQLQVRATDGTGATQPSERTPPAPDGARGYHQIRVNAG